MEDLIVVSKLGDQLSKYFNEDEFSGQKDMEALREKLVSSVMYMLMHEMEKLLNLLYRIDVNEKKVKEVFAGPDARQIAPALAQLIIDRELQKVASRYKHR